jgi:N6-L-threonylcarbamoyladenine synthase
MTVLGIETSCDETAAAVIRWSTDSALEILSDVIWTQVAAHAPYRGVVPEIAARAHVEAIDHVIAAAMQQAQLTFARLDVIAATAGPGLIGGVMVGLTAGKAIAMAHCLPLVAVNHLEGHALSPRISAPAPFPYLLLLVSGGHCQFLSVTGIGHYIRLGTTRDDAAGEAFDKAAKVMGFGYPGGPLIEAAAQTGNPSRFALPRPLVGTQGCDFSFAGLKSAAARAYSALEAPSDEDRADLAAAFQLAATDILVDRSRNAMTQFAETIGDAPKRFLVAGGVAANTPLRAALSACAVGNGFSFAAPPLRFCTDNAVMIALAGAERAALGLTDDLTVAARPRWPLDEIAALERPSHKPGRKGAKA